MNNKKKIKQIVKNNSKDNQLAGRDIYNINIKSNDAKDVYDIVSEKKERVRK